jgi:DNA-binding protein YbaB
MQVRKETKRLQNEMERITCDYANGGISCTVRGDFSVSSIKVSPEAVQELIAGKPERFETMLLNVVNGAIKGVRRQTQERMSAMMKDGGLKDLLGGLGG